MVNTFTLILCLCLLIQLLYWHYLFLAIAKSSKKAGFKGLLTQKISLIICAHKDHSKLRDHLLAFLKQDHPNYRVLLIDNSPDARLARTYEDLKRSFHHFEIHAPAEIRSKGKKRALKYALQLCSGEDVMLSDADCYPASSSWLSEMQNVLCQESSDLVLGYSPYLIPKKNFLNQWIHYEALMTAISYLSFALKKMPYMGVGRNTLYRKGLFESRLLDQHDDIRSGDDDLTINALSERADISICIKPEAHVYTWPSSSWKSYVRQKTRHYSTAHRYKFKHILLLSLYSLCHFVFYILVLSFLLNKLFILALGVYLIRCLSIAYVYYKIKDGLQAQISPLKFILFDFVHIFFYVFFVFPVLIPQKSKW